jgi:flagellar basal body rod protein FlgG
MTYGLWLSASGMAANQYRQNVAANNLANVDTVGFKHDLATLIERPVESREDADAAVHANLFFDRLGGGTFVKPTRHAFVQGPAMPTGQPLDAMIEGSGYFQVDTPDGVRFTRDGRFTVSADGRLVTVAGGHAVLDQAGAPMAVVPGGPAAVLDSEGRFKQGDIEIGRLGVAAFEDESLLRKTGANLFTPTGDARPRTIDARIVPGTLEGSTVDPIDGLTDMIEITRSFEINANMLRAQEQSLGRLLTEVARF